MQLCPVRNLKFRLPFLFLILAHCAYSAYASSLSCEVLPTLFKVFLTNHYAYNSMTETIKARTIQQLIKELDPSKSILLESDVAKLRKDLPAIFETMNKGDCSVLNELSSVILARVKEDEAFVRGFLGKDYKLDENAELTLNPDKRSYAKSPEERRSLLVKMIHFQISNYLLADTKLDDAKTRLIHRYELIVKRVSERKMSDLLEFYAEAFATSLDPHTSYLSQEAMEDFQIQMRLSLEGIGASLSSEDGFTVIEELIPGGGAERSRSLRPKDKIIAVRQEGAPSVPVIDMDLRDVVKMIRGKKGTKVTLTILRQAEKTETLSVTITRDKIDVKEQAAKIIYETRKRGDKILKIGVIDLPSFYGGEEKKGRSAYQDVKNLLKQAKKEKVDGIVLNLERNGGGLLDYAVKISGLFIQKGAVVATKDANKQVSVLSGDGEEVVYDGPLVVLTSRLSASAAEILAGALKNYRRALIVGGDHTFGKGTVQVFSPLPRGYGAMKITTSMFFLPGGESTQHAGVSSDLQLPSVFNTEDIGEKAMDYSLPSQSIPPFISRETNSAGAAIRWAPVESGTVEKLAAKSRERVSQNEKFIEISKEIEESLRNKGVVRLADLRRKTEVTNKTEKQKKEKKSRRARLDDAELPFIEESVNIAADWIALSSPTHSEFQKIN